MNWVTPHRSNRAVAFKYGVKSGGMRTAMDFMAPYIADKKSWPHAADVQYFDQFPVRQPSLLFAGLAYAEPSCLELWSKLNPDPAVDEVIRNYPVRQPVLWVS